MNNTPHPNVEIIYGADFFPERKEPQILYLYGSIPGEPLTVACGLTPARFTILQTLVRERNYRIFGYNAERRPAQIGH